MDIAALHREHTSGGGTKTYRELAVDTGLSWDAVRGRIRRHVEKHTQNDHTSEFNHPQREIAPTQTPPQPAPLALYTPYPVEWDDRPLWEECKENWARVHKYYRALCIYDLHIPDESEKFLKLVYNVAFYLQPDVILFPGDFLDFDALSTKFEMHNRRMLTDPLEEIAPIWEEIIDHLSMQCRKAKIVAFAGNHERRRDTATAKWAWGGERRFVEIVRSKGRVWWLPEVEETTLGGLFIKHGDKYGENAAKNLLKSGGFAGSIIQGHGHVPNFYVQRRNLPNGEYTIAQAMTIGCGSNIPPHYQVNRKNDSLWINSVGLATVRLDCDYVDLQDFIFHPDPEHPGELCCEVGIAHMTSCEDIGYR